MTVDELKNIGSDVIAFAEAEYQKAKALPGDNAARMIAVYGIVVEVVQKAQAVRADFAGMTAADVEGLAVTALQDVLPLVLNRDLGIWGKLAFMLLPASAMQKIIQRIVALVLQALHIAPAPAK